MSSKRDYATVNPGTNSALERSNSSMGSTRTFTLPDEVPKVLSRSITRSQWNRLKQGKITLKVGNAKKKRKYVVVVSTRVPKHRSIRCAILNGNRKEYGYVDPTFPDDYSVSRFIRCLVYAINFPEQVIERAKDQGGVGASNFRCVHLSRSFSMRFN